MASKSLERSAAGERRQPTLQPGQTLRDRYQILRILGTGGMSAVYEARDLSFPNVVRLVAIKEILSAPGVAGPDEAARALIQREVDILASLNHPAIPKIYEYFQAEPHLYLVLELIHGQDLETFLVQSAEPLPERTVVRWAIEICDVLHYLHTRQPEPIIFRDMKPSNVMLNEHGHIVLIDFGIAKIYRGEKRGTMIGTEGYSPPEQYRGEASPLSDIYSLGATMHHLLTARDPTKEAPFSFAERPLRRFNPTVSPAVEAVVTRMLAYDPKDRYANALEARQALEAAQKQTLAAGSAPAAPTTLCLDQPAAEEEDTQPVWRFRCEDEIRSSPRVSQGVVFIGCYDNNLYAIEAKAGAFLWKYPTEGGIAATPAIWEETIFIGSEDFNMYAISARTGRMMWVCPTKGRIRSSARVAYEHVFFGSDDNFIYGVHARTGRLVWKSPTEGPVRSTPFIQDETLFAGCEDGQVYAINLRRGALQWRHNCGGGVTSSPLVWEGLLIVGSADRSVYALDINSGMPVWRFRTGQAVISSPAVHNGTVYIGSADNCLYALEATGGRLRWKFETAGQVNSSPFVTSEAVYVGSGDSQLYCVDARTGRLRWKFKAQGPIVSSPYVVEGVVYVGSLDGWLYALPA